MERMEFKNLAMLQLHFKAQGIDEMKFETPNYASFDFKTNKQYKQKYGFILSYDKESVSVQLRDENLNIIKEIWDNEKANKLIGRIEMVTFTNTEGNNGND